MSDRTTETPPSFEGAELSAWPGLGIEARFPGAEGRYVIKATLGVGGQGIVYLAVDRSLNQHVAIKTLRPERFNPEAMNRFEIEARNQVALPVRSEILRVLDWGVGDDHGWSVPFLVMEYRAGAKPLHEFVKLNQVSRRERLELWTKVCDAVGHLHAQSLTHRDLKPGNILVTRDGQPIIIDFGLSLSPATYVQRLNLPTELGGLFGTVGYMSPEQAAKEDSSAIAASTDVYALGVIGYELLLGHDPYSTPATQRRGLNGRPTESFLDEIREARVVDPLRRDPTLHPSAARILRKALARRADDSPNARYRDSGRLTEDLKRFSRRATWSAPLTFVAAVVITVGLGLFVANTLAFGRLNLNWIFQRTIRALAPDQSLNHVRVIHRGDLAKVERAISALGLPDWVVPPSDGSEPPESQPQPVVGPPWPTKTSSRLLWMMAATRLIENGSLAVAIDIPVLEPSDVPAADDAVSDLLARHPKALERIVFSDVWLGHGQSHTKPPYATEDSLRYGGFTLLASDESAWLMEICLQGESGPLQPSMALSAAATALGAPDRPGYSVDAASRIITVVWSNPKTGERSGQPAIQFRFTDLERVDDDLILDSTLIMPKGLTGRLALFPMPSDASLAAAQIDLSTVLRAKPSELRGLAEGKIFVLGMAEGSDDLHPHLDGRKIYGPLAHAVAIENLITNRTVIAVRAGANLTVSAVAAACALGALPLVGRRRFRAAASVIATIMAAIFVLCVAVFFQTSQLMEPFTAMAAAALAIPIFLLTRRVLSFVMSIAIFRSHLWSSS